MATTTFSVTYILKNGNKDHSTWQSPTFGNLREDFKDLLNVEIEESVYLESVGIKAVELFVETNGKRKAATFDMKLLVAFKQMQDFLKTLDDE